MRVTVDADRCTGHGRCYSLAPEVFEPDETGHSAVITADLSPGLESQARLGVENCPEQAINLVG